MAEIVYEHEFYQILGAYFEVYKQMGTGFLEAVYQECLTIEFTSQQISFVAQPSLQIHYHEQILKQRYIPDFICYEKIIVELKAVKELANKLQAQVFNYLRATNLKLGLLVNFGHYPGLQWERNVF